MEFNLETPEQKKPCKGLVFRGYRNMFMSGELKVELKQGIRLLKKKSCPGCDQCGFLWEDISNMVWDESIIFPEIEHGKLYSVRVINISRDWETGYVDDWDLEVFLLDDQ